MADKSKAYLVLHPVRHDGRLHDRGKTIILEDKHALSLVAIGSIKAKDAETSAPAEPDAVVALTSMTKAALIEYAFDKFQIAIPDTKTKPEIIAAIEAAAEAAK